MTGMQLRETIAYSLQDRSNGKKVTTQTQYVLLKYITHDQLYSLSEPNWPIRDCATQYRKGLDYSFKKSACRVSETKSNN